MKIAIASGKGGTGKTTLSVNLATYISEKYESEEVILVDLDVEEPNSGLFISGELVDEEDKFKEIPEWNPEMCTFCGKCQTVCNFNAVIKLGNNIMVFPELCHGCYACSDLCPSDSLPMVQKKMGELKYYQSNKLSFVESRLVIGEEQAVPLIKQTKKYVNEKFSADSIAIYDSPPGTSCPVIETIKDVDIVLLITEPTPFGFNDLKLAIETVRNLKKKFFVVINKYGIGDNKVEKYCEDKNIKIIGKIPNSKDVAGIYSQGKLLYRDVETFEREIKKIADFVLPEEERMM